MVWIHGGKWAFGDANKTNMAMLCSYTDVVVVTVSFRLNALGFLFGNWGLWDILEGIIENFVSNGK